MEEKNRLSVIVPCKDEESCIEQFVKEVSLVCKNIPLEFVFVDDGSSDGTLREIKKLADGDGRVRYVSFSRNFGKEAALLAGLEHCTGEIAVTMDVDLQHRPQLLPEMYEAIVKEGYDCAAARRTDRKGEPAIRSWFARRFYSVMSRFSDVDLVDGSMDYRMMKRQVVDEILKLREANRFTKGIYQWVGFKTRWFEADNAERVSGTTKWSFAGLAAYSVRGIVAFSTAPLQLASVLGALFCIPTFGYIVYIVFKWAFLGEKAAGSPTLMCAVVMLGGLQLLVIGILGTYIAGIYRESKRRPVYIARECK